MNEPKTWNSGDACWVLIGRTPTRATIVEVHASKLGAYIDVGGERTWRGRSQIFEAKNALQVMAAQESVAVYKAMLAEAEERLAALKAVGS